MSTDTKIQWTDATLNPWIGCRKVSEGCANCYIVRTPPLRTRGMKHGAERYRVLSFEKSALALNRKAAREGRRIRVFPSLCDWLDDDVPVEWLADFLAVVRRTPALDWQLLTKRPENWQNQMERVQAWAIHRWPDGPYGDAHNMAMLWEAKGCPPANVWIGVSAETQARLDERVPLLLRIPARVRFVSAEPLLGPLDFASLRWPDADGVAAGDSAGIDWLIVGGESGPGARPCDVAWIRSIVRQCADAGVACFVKQLGARPYLSPEHDGGTGFNLTLRDKKGGDPAEWPADLRVRQLPK